MAKQKINFNCADQDLKVLPHSEKIEKKVVAFTINVPDIIPAAIKYLKFEGLFYNEWNLKVWDAVVFMHNKNMTVTVENVAEHFRVIGEYEIVPYVQSMGMLNEWYVASDKFKVYCLRLNELAISRTTTRLGYHLNQGGLDPQKDALELIGEASDGLDKIYKHIASLQEKSKDDAVQKIYQNMHDSKTSPTGMLGVPSSLRGINERIKGYRKTNLIIIAASTGEGKTTLALQDAVHMAELGKPVGYISLEMSTEELIMITASDRLKIDTSDLLAGSFSADDQERVTNYMNKFKALPIEISEKAGLKISEIKALARMWKKDKGIEALFLDHIHLAYDDTENSAEQRYTNIANKLKELAKELNIPVIALAQLSRREKTDKNRRHAISDIKYAGGIEQAADVVLLIYRPILHGIDRGKDGQPLPENSAVIIVGKLRLLKKWDIKCEFNGTSFANPSDDFKQGGFTGINPDKRHSPYSGMKNFHEPKKEQMEDPEF